MGRRVFITVAEVSGDQHAAQLARNLRQLDPTIVVEGHGGPRMRAAGVHIHQDTTGKAAMSWQALGRITEMWKLLKWTQQYYDQTPPDLHVCIDSPAVNLSFAKAAHERGVKVLYYIPPQLWAWRIQERRMKKLRRWVDEVACILPFEEEYFRRRGVHATYVGHPLFDALPAKREQDPAKKFPNRPPVIGLLTGSRRSEANANFPHLMDVARQIRQIIPTATFLAPTTAQTHGTVSEMIAESKHNGTWALPGETPEQAAAHRLPIQFAQDMFDKMVPQCDLCITKSGTSTLHVAGYAVPMIVVYRGNPVLWNLIGRLLIKTRTYSLVNVLNDCHEHIVPEFIPWYGSNKPVVDCAMDFLNHPEKLQDQHEKLLHVIRNLDRPGASQNTAKLALSMIAARPAHNPIPAIIPPLPAAAE